ncbi:MAG: nucleotide exchange factor GrpE [Dehalococcoidia bacterium]|nr:nucleotide exchange factor GrpE [Dehalococcoidia bacterium]
MALLEAYDVCQIDAAGKAFDPSCHQAVQETDGEAGKILHVVQQGYTFGGQVLRPALVVVGKNQAKPASQP